VIGSAGSDEKVKLLIEEYGYDAAFNYKNGPVSEQMAKAAPDGIGVFFDNVGGEHLEAAIGALTLHVRIVLCGMVSQYNDEKVVGPRNLWNPSVTRSDTQAFMASEELDLQPGFVREVCGWLAEGRLRVRLRHALTWGPAVRATEPSRVGRTASSKHPGVTQNPTLPT
jgi:NADPH-dependent curcumin reductase CurA